MTPSPLEARADTGTAPLRALALALLLAVQSACLLAQRTPLFEDDALFYLRYADNLAAGHGFRWNPEEPPICGASAPLWPILIAAAERLGLGPEHAALAWSWVFALGAAWLLGLAVLRLQGVLGVLCLAPLLAVNHLVSTWSTSGLESPMTFFLIAAAIRVAVGPSRGWILGLVAGLLLFHKVDVVPLGLALLAGTAIWRRSQLATALPVALLFAAAWYGWAVATFGAALPNSFTSKLHASYGGVGWGWFAEQAFLVRAGVLRTVLGALGLVALRRQPFVAGIALTQVVVPAVAYSLFPPPEPFMWYVAATAPALAFLSACGLAVLLRAAAPRLSRPARVSLAGLGLAALGAVLLRMEAPAVRAWHAYVERVHLPLRRAGQWVDRNTPADTRVITSWGNSAYYSKRFVYDATFLNRRRERGDLIAKYRPEAWIWLSWSELEAFEPRRPYRIVWSRESSMAGRPLFVAVLLRGE